MASCGPPAAAWLRWSSCSACSPPPARAVRHGRPRPRPPGRERRAPRPAAPRRPRLLPSGPRGCAWFRWPACSSRWPWPCGRASGPSTWPSRRPGARHQQRPARPRPGPGRVLPDCGGRRAEPARARFLAGGPLPACGLHRPERRHARTRKGEHRMDYRDPAISSQPRPCLADIADHRRPGGGPGRAATASPLITTMPAPFT